MKKIKTRNDSLKCTDFTQYCYYMMPVDRHDHTQSSTDYISQYFVSFPFICEFFISPTKYSGANRAIFLTFLSFQEQIKVPDNFSIISFVDIPFSLSVFSLENFFSVRYNHISQNFHFSYHFRTFINRNMIVWINAF